MNYVQEIKSFNDWLIINPTVTSDDIVLWYALMSLNNISGWQKEFTVAISTLVDRSRLSRSAIYRSRNKLVQMGRIKTKERSGNQCSVYELLPFVSHMGTQSGTQNGTQDGTQAGTQSGTINKLNETKPLNIEFETFWDAYDKKVGKKSSLVKTWASFSDQVRSEIMAYIPKYKEAQPDKQFRKDPSTFFNQEGWTHEIIPRQPTPLKPAEKPAPVYDSLATLKKATA